MSAEATGWVFRHSPYRGVEFAIHLAIADTANDAYENKLWMRCSVLAKKARTTRATVNRHLAKMVDDGYLALVEQRPGHASKYRFLFPVGAEVVYDSRHQGGVSREHRGCVERTQGGVSREHTEPKGNPKEDADPPSQPGEMEGSSNSNVSTYVKELAARVEKAGGTLDHHPDSVYAGYAELLAKAITLLDVDPASTAMGVIGAFAAKAGQPLTPAERSHTAKHVRTHDPTAVLRAWGEAVDWGAGDGDEWADDPKARTKYVTKILSNGGR